MTSVFRNTAQLTFDEYIQNISIRVGMSPTSIQNLWRTLSGNEIIRPDAFPNPSKKSVAHLGELIFKMQLHPGEHAVRLWATMLESIHSKLTPEGLTKLPALISSGEVKVLSLRRLIFSILVGGSTTSFFGDELLKIEPHLLEHFEAFDESSWKLSYRVPKPWAKDMLSAMNKLSTALQKYAERSKERRAEACWMIQTLEGEFRGANLESRDIGLQLLMIYWV
jgi:hypothetical protein